MRALHTAVDALCQELDPVSLTVEGLGQTNDYFTFLYVKLANDDPQQVFNRATSVFSGGCAPKIGPHVSLMYSERLTNIDRCALQEELRSSLPPRLLFTSIQLVMPATSNWRDVASWEVHRSARLTA